MTIRSTLRALVPLLVLTFVAVLPCAPAQTVAGPTDISLVGGDVSGVFDRVAPAVVGISARLGRVGVYCGTGTILDPTGLVLTSTTVVPKGADEIVVYLKGGKAVPAKLAVLDEPNEMSLIRIDDGGAGRPYPFVDLGDSSRVELGAPAMTFGNAFRSIETDDQVSVGFGIVSGFYELGKTPSESKYSGPAIETSAPLNGGTDGGPLIDAQGRVLGVLSLNYSVSRWLGTAVPIDRLKPKILPELSRYREAAEDGAAYLGLDLEEGAPGEILVMRVEPGSPAAEGGLKAGQRVEAIRGERPATVRGVRDILRRVRPGDAIRFEVSADGTTRTTELRAWGRF